MIAVYVLLCIPFGWAFISRLQRNVTVFTSISNYIVYKIILATFIGWAIAPFYLIYIIFKMIRGFSSKKDTPIK